MSSAPDPVLRGPGLGGEAPAARGRGGDRRIDGSTDRPTEHTKFESSSQVKIMRSNVRSQGTHLSSLPALARLPGLPSPLGNLSPSFNQEPAARRGSPGPPAVHTDLPILSASQARHQRRPGLLSLPISTREQMQSTPTSKHSQDPGTAAPRPPVLPITAGHLRTMLAPPGSPDELTAPRLGLSSERPRPCRCPVLVPSSTLTSGRRACAAAPEACLAPDRTSHPLCSGSPPPHRTRRLPGPEPPGHLAPRRGAFCAIYRLVMSSAPDLPLPLTAVPAEHTLSDSGLCSAHGCAHGRRKHL